MAGWNIKPFYYLFISCESILSLNCHLLDRELFTFSSRALNGVPQGLMVIFGIQCVWVSDLGSNTGSPSGAAPLVKTMGNSLRFFEC